MMPLFSMNSKSSDCSATSTAGRACNNANISRRFLRFPQANSPMTKGWHTTIPSRSIFANASLPSRRWDTHIDVSTRTMTYVPTRRLGVALIDFSVPPNFAKRSLLFNAIKASSPIRTRAVFSRTPVRSDALARSSSSMFNVVLIVTHFYLLYFVCISMHLCSTAVKAFLDENIPPGTTEKQPNAAVR